MICDSWHKTPHWPSTFLLPEFVFSKCSIKFNKKKKPFYYLFPVSSPITGVRIKAKQFVYITVQNIINSQLKVHFFLCIYLYIYKESVQGRTVPFNVFCKYLELKMVKESLDSLIVCFQQEINCEQQLLVPKRTSKSARTWTTQTLLPFKKKNQR